MTYLGIFLSYLLLYKYVALFIIVFFAGIIIPLPINTLLMAVGAFSVQGYFSFTLSLVVATVSNVLGDMLDYWVFRRYGHAVLREKYANKYSFFLRLEDYLKRHTAISILVSRVVGILGPPVNFLSGYLKINFGKFLFYDVIGNTVFVLIFLIIGYLLGDEWQNITGFVSLASGTVLVLALLGVIWIVYRRRK